jgi:hypothetical protein
MHARFTRDVQLRAEFAPRATPPLRRVVAPALQKRGVMKTLIVCTVLFASALAYAQDASRDPLLLVVESGPVRLDAEALASAIHAETESEIVLTREGASTVLTITWLRADRWIVRVERGDRSEHHIVSTGPSFVAALARSSRAVLSRLSAPAARPFAWRDDDLLDPFHGRWAWDPLAAAVRDEVIAPFGHGPDFVCAAVADPFTREAAIDLLDPWPTR